MNVGRAAREMVVKVEDDQPQNQQSEPIFSIPKELLLLILTAHNLSARSRAALGQTCKYFNAKMLTTPLNSNEWIRNLWQDKLSKLLSQKSWKSEIKLITTEPKTVKEIFDKLNTLVRMLNSFEYYCANVSSTLTLKNGSFKNFHSDLSHARYSKDQGWRSYNHSRDPSLQAFEMPNESHLGKRFNYFIKNTAKKIMELETKACSTDWPALLAAEDANDTKKLAEIAANIFPHARDQEGGLLHKAAEEGRDKLIHALVESAGVPVDQLKYGKTPLMFAVKEGKLPAVQILIENYDAYVNHIVEPKYTPEESPLSLAISNGHPEIAMYLIEKGASDHNRNSCLRLALNKGYKEEGYEKIVISLLSAVSNPKTFFKDEFHLTSADVCFFIDHHIDISKFDPKGELFQEIFFNCRSRDVELIKKFIENRDTLLQNPEGNSPLMLACKKDKYLLVKILLENGAAQMIGEVNKHNETALLMACKTVFNLEKMVRLLLEYGALDSIDVVDNWGENILVRACHKYFSPSALKILLENGANKSKYFNEAFLKACQQNNTYAVQLFLVNGAKEETVNYKSTFATPLIAACEAKSIQLVQLLLEHGANKTINKKCWGKSALKIAKEKNLNDIVELLLQHGAT